MAAPQSSSSTSGTVSLEVRDFINRSDRQITIRGTHESIYSICTTVIDQGYNQQPTHADGLWCALFALEISCKAICQSIGKEPLDCFKDFLRLRMGLEYAQWATEECAKGHVTQEMLETELMAYNNFSVEIMAQLVWLARFKLGEIFRLGVCSKSKQDETWDVYLCPCEVFTETLWVINDNVVRRATGETGANREPVYHWSGIGPDPLPPTIENGANEEAVNHWPGIGPDPLPPTIEVPEGNSAEEEADEDEDEGEESRSGDTETAESDSEEFNREEAPIGKKRKSPGTSKAPAAKKARVGKANNIRDEPYNYRKTNDAPPSNTDLPYEHMASITLEELWVYFPNHCQEWPALALRLVNAGSETTGRWSWLAASVDQSRLLETEVHHRKRYAIPNTINKKMTAAVTKALGVAHWDKKKHEALPQEVVASMPRGPPQGSGRLERAWPLWRIGANLVRHDWPGVFRDRVLADMLAHPQEVAQEQARLAQERH